MVIESHQVVQVYRIMISLVKYDYSQGYKQYRKRSDCMIVNETIISLSTRYQIMLDVTVRSLSDLSIQVHLYLHDIRVLCNWFLLMKYISSFTSVYGFVIFEHHWRDNNCCNVHLVLYLYWYKRVYMKWLYIK